MQNLETLQAENNLIDGDNQQLEEQTSVQANEPAATKEDQE